MVKYPSTLNFSVIKYNKQFDCNFVAKLIFMQKSFENDSFLHDINVRNYELQILLQFSYLSPTSF
jgi:hypothetical protein